MNISIFFLDGIVLKVRDTARKVRRRMILVAYGVTRTGLRRVLAYQFAQDESQAAGSSSCRIYFCVAGR